MAKIFNNDQQESLLTKTMKAKQTREWITRSCGVQVKCLVNYAGLEQ